MRVFFAAVVPQKSSSQVLYHFTFWKGSCEFRFGSHFGLQLVYF